MNLYYVESFDLNRPEEGGLCTYYPAVSLQYQHGRNTALCCEETDVVLVIHGMVVPNNFV